MKLHIVGRIADSQGDEEPSAAGIGIGRSLASLLNVAVQLNRAIVNAVPTSTQLVAANDQRLCAVIRNKGVTPLHVDQPPAFPGGNVETDVIAPGAEWDSDEAVTGAIFGWWDTLPGGVAPTGYAIVTEMVPFLGSYAASGGGGSGGGTVTVPQATSNATWGGGAAAGAIVGTPGHLYSVTVTSSGNAPLALLDGPGGPEIAYVPANFPGGDVPLYAIKRFATSLYAQSGPGTPAISVGVSS